MSRNHPSSTVGFLLPSSSQKKSLPEVPVDPFLFLTGHGSRSLLMFRGPLIHYRFARSPVVILTHPKMVPINCALLRISSCERTWGLAFELLLAMSQHQWHPTSMSFSAALSSWAAWIWMFWILMVGAKSVRTPVCVLLIFVDLC